MLRPASLVLSLLAGCFGAGSSGHLAAQAPSPPGGKVRWGEAADHQVAAARERTLAACRERQIELPADFLAWIEREAACTP